MSLQDWTERSREFFDRPIVRVVISRGAMLVLGVTLLFGAMKCFAAQWQISNDATGYVADDRASSALPFLIGIVLAILGGVFAIASVIPTRWLFRIGRPPRATLGEVPEIPRGWENLL